MFEGGAQQETMSESGVVFGESDISLPALLLHACCGPCSASVVEQLASRFRITLYFCNSNIDTEEEFNKRLDAQKTFVEKYNADLSAGEPVSLICAAYEPEPFDKLVQGTEHCQEGGARCRLCIRDRLERTADYAKMNGYEYYSTTLSVSRHKDHGMILNFGKALGLRYGLVFVDDDYKQDGGELRSVELSKKYGLYRQTYCGCSCSKK